MNPLAFLGLKPDADGAYEGSQITESAVKRAYAQKLKITRPDDDPAGFQQLNEAYQAALQICRGLQQRKAARTRQTEQTNESAGKSEPTISQAGGPAPTTGASAPPNRPPARWRTWDADFSAVPSPQSAPPVAVFGPDAFLQEIEQVAAQNGDAKALHAWLQQYPALYALQDKARAGAAVQARLASGGLDPLTPGQCQALAAFFDFWLDPQWLERRAARRAIQTGDFSDYDEQPLTGLYPNRFLLNRIKRPLSYWRAAWVAVIPRMSMRIVQMGKLLSTSYGCAPNQLPPGLDAASFAFYSRLADPAYFGRWRGVQIVLREGIIAAIVMVLPREGIIAAIVMVLPGLKMLFALPLLWSGAAWLRAKMRTRRPAQPRQAMARWKWWWLFWLLIALAQFFTLNNRH